ncbi:TPA: phage major capsid protein [Pseudomonas aeruginosa]|uniref:Capsid polyprotein n=1 Tax=Pseudomonas phage PAJU2 TaxID=504346 RepID=CAPSD_BPPAJ|nr:phage major capsid protein [Pseudomonas aeruginosa]YP_002284337.1 major head protein [Pseudomonas phage PAJU2]P85500.2 RecName: Full=Capsid polyprotein; AltName: Full=ORF3 protein; Contains: RecName: Full=Capsid protein [Pseudomonas phage PAJU2]MUH87331.1 phage major capsid protein [Pseudomonas aeruginosa]BAG74987.1 structural protein [Pseudomonas phage PAJU2]HBO3004330.1 phage major capsid protein [Pseudomonas aeruginosa]HBO4694687.1 phage major capsid protein [Pseudomonas aeruginosa]
MKTNRAYSTLEVKALDDEKRVITGIASTPSPDRMQDVVEPKGAQFKLPIPFLWQHNHDEPIGHVTEAKVTQKGIEVSVQLTQVEEPGKLKDRLDEAWQSIKSGLVRGLSIGFSAKEFEQIPGSWGLRFLSWEWFELSAVTIPANAEATITSVKSIDREQRAALGIKSVPVVRVTPAGASAIKTKTIKVPKPQEGNDMKTTAEQIAEFEATRVTKAAEMEAIMTKAAEAGETLDAEQSEQFDTLEAEIAAIDKHIGRLKQMQKAQAANAKPVTEEAGAQRMANVKALDFKEVQVRAKNTQKLEPGIAFARAAKCLALGHLEHRDAIGIAKSLYDGQDSIIAATQRLVTKAAVAAATTSDATWAGPLVGDETSVFADFVEYLRPQTILGRFGTNGIPSLRRVPFRVPLIGQTSGGDGYWVGEGQAKPLTKFDFERKTLEPLKVANIAVATMEVIRDSSPSADVIIRDQLAAALRERLDIDFIDPAKAAVAGVSPASILNGVAGIPSSGNTADDVRADIRALFNAFIAANNAPTSGVWLMPATTALALSLMQNPLGQAEFPGISMTGGTLFGLPVIVSEYIPTASAGAVVALVNASDIYLGDEGGVDLSMSTEASLQMDNAPDNPTTASTVLVSLWQRNLVGFRAERAINWARRRASAVAYLTGVNWGAA